MSHLVTTALKHTFKNDKKNILLGIWCKIYNKKYDESFETNNEHHWNNRDKLNYDYEEIEKTYEKILKNLQENLNKYHGTKFSLKYWRIFIGPWLSNFLHSTFDKWENIRIFKKKYIINSTSVIKIKNIDIIPNTLEEYNKLMSTDIWNHYIYSKVIKHHYENSIVYEDIEIDYKWKKNPLAGSFDTNLSEIKGIKKSKFLILFYKIINKIYYYLKKDDDIFIYKTYLGKNLEKNIRINFNQIPSHFLHLEEKKNLVEKLNREILRLNFECKNQFENFIKDIIIDLIPLIYIENFKYFKSSLLDLPFPKNPKLILSSHILNNSQTSLYTAEKLENGCKLVYGQHGGVYGQYKFSWKEKHELEVCDKYLTWGWKKKNDKKIIPFGTIKDLDNYKFNSQNLNYSNNLLLICRARSRYEHKLNSSNGVNQFDKYINDNLTFGSHLEPKIKKDLIVRLHTRKYGWLEDERWKDLFNGNIEVDWGDKPIINMINNSKLVVCSYIGTTYLETLPKNIPTIIFEDFKNTLFRDDVKEHLNELKNANILFENPESASKFVNKNWNNLSEWWLDKNTQEIIKNFCQIYSKKNENKLKELSEIIKSEI
jgi:putative transferase (TIGR04331 family)